jgi:aspartate/methionine/tyrosine aminotransferase
MSHPWLAARTAQFDSSGIRKVFDLAAKMKNPINLSIGQPDFPVPDEIKRAAVDAINADRNGYSQTQGIPDLRERLQADLKKRYGHDDRRVLVTSGTSGALMLAMLALVDPGDEVIIFDPYFVMYPALVAMVGGKAVYVDTYPDFRIDLDKVAAAITPKTKLILFNSPANPTGVVTDAQASSATTPPCPPPPRGIPTRSSSTASASPTPSPAGASAGSMAPRRSSTS